MEIVCHTQIIAVAALFQKKTKNNNKKTLELNWFSPHLSIDWTAGSAGKVKISGQQIQLVKYDTSLSKQTWFGS